MGPALQQVPSASCADCRCPESTLAPPGHPQPHRSASSRHPSRPRRDGTAAAALFLHAQHRNHTSTLFMPNHLGAAPVAHVSPYALSPPSPPPPPQRCPGTGCAVRPRFHQSLIVSVRHSWKSGTPAETPAPGGGFGGAARSRAAAGSRRACGWFWGGVSGACAAGTGGAGGMLPNAGLGLSGSCPAAGDARGKPSGRGGGMLRERNALSAPRHLSASRGAARAPGGLQAAPTAPAGPWEGGLHVPAVVPVARLPPP